MNRNEPLSEKLFGSVKVLTPAEIDQIITSSLSILQDVGIRFDDPEAVQTLVDAGASVFDNTVRFPNSLVNHCLQTIASKVVLGARDPEASLTMGQSRFVTTNGFGTMNVLEYGHESPRPSTAMDLVQLTRLADNLDDVGYCQHQTTPQDVSTELLDVIQAFIVLTNTSKHAHLSTYTSQHLDAIFELGRIAADQSNQHVVSLGCCSFSPLRFSAEATGVLTQAAKCGIPFLIVCGAISGVTSPVTLAGTLVTQTAEHLAGVVLAQCVRPGTPVLLGSFSSPMDPRSGMQGLASAELSLLNGATAQICREFGIPFGYGTGGVSDACSVDVQAGMEKAITTLSCALAGVEVIHDGVAGILDSGKLVSYEQMIIDAELCRTVRRILQGIEVSEESLALSTISEIGVGGNYPSCSHTVRHFREEILLSNLWDSAAGGEARESVVVRANRRVRDLMQQPAKGPTLSDDQIDAMIDVCTREGISEQFARSLLPEN